MSNREKHKKHTRKRGLAKNKKQTILAIFVVLVLAILIVFAIFYLQREENPNSAQEKELKQDIEDLQKEFGDESDITVEDGEAPADPKTAEVDVTAIPGFIQKAGEGVESENVKGMTFPYQIPDSNLQILAVGQYTGPFVETGEDTPVSNVMSLVVKNTGNQMVEYSEVELSAGDKDSVLFKISALPAGTAVLVQESNQKEFSQDTVYTYSGATEALSADDKTLQEDKFQITGEDGKLTVKNLTDEDIDKIYICYRTISDGGVYLGGIAYRVSAENVEAGAEKSIESGHYLQKYSSILFVEIASAKAY